MVEHIAVDGSVINANIELTSFITFAIGIEIVPLPIIVVDRNRRRGHIGVAIVSGRALRTLRAAA